MASGQTLDGLRVLAFESRRAEDMQRLIARSGGVPLVVPAMREIPREHNTEALAFARDLAAGAFHVVIFLTGVGARALARVVEPVLASEQLAAALDRVSVVVRGPKPAAALRQIGVAKFIAVPAPHTWREVLQLFDSMHDSLPIGGRAIAVQEYGESNEPLLEGLRERGARVTRVPVYDWALPEDPSALRAVVKSAAAGDFDVLLFTTSVQVRHVMGVAAELGVEAALRDACARALIGSIGPTTSEELLSHGLTPDFEPPRSNMALLVLEAANRGVEALARKRAGTGQAGPPTQAGLS